MSLMKQYARNKRNKENTIVLTARLPESLYNKFQSYCEEYGFSLSEAVNLLIDNEVSSIETDIEPNTKDVKMNDVETKVNTVEYNENTNKDELNTITVEMNTVENKEVKANTNKSQTTTPKRTTNTKRFTVQPFVVEGELPCPVCDKWINHSNFARHAKKQHEMSTEEFFNEYKDQINTMIEAKKAEIVTRQGEIKL
jgi:antitoxin component of RelBE/YafQ-DinJ toxin-antitoxin module